MINLQYKKLKLDHLVCNDMQSSLLKRKEAVKLISTNIEELLYSKPSGTGSPQQDIFQLIEEGKSKFKKL
jgi:hypothetical protein